MGGLNWFSLRCRCRQLQFRLRPVDEREHGEAVGRRALGYPSTFVAGFLALIYIVRGFFTKTLDADTGKSLAG